MKKFDYDKAREICKNEYVKYAEGGLREDWNWTAGTIYENGKFDKDGVGYDHSIWATPVIEYTTTDGQTYVLDCFIDDNVKEDPKAISMGRLFASATGGRELGE